MSKAKNNFENNRPAQATSSYRDCNQLKRKFFVGLACFVVGIVCAVGAHLHAQTLDIGNLLMYDTSDVRVYGFVASLLAGFALLGIPFIQLGFVKRIFALIFYLITHNSEKFKFTTKSDADTIVEMSYDNDGNVVFGEEKSRLQVVLECILGIVLLVVGGLIVYAVGIFAGVFVLLAQMIMLIKQKNK